MPISGDCPKGRSQLLMFRRRNFLQGLVSAILPFISKPVSSASRRRSSPKFKIGDEVRASWASDGSFGSALGHVTGICWHPVKHHWEYLIFWHGSSFDEQLTDSEDLELSHYA